MLALENPRHEDLADANESRTCLIADRPRLSDRLSARWCYLRLDLALAAGTPAESGAALALRARRLTDLSNADALFEPGPVAPRGVAQARMLLTDGTGALFNARSDASLRASAVTAIENLRLRSA